MAKVKVLQRRVVGHQWRDPGTVVEVGDAQARTLTEQDPEGFVWLDRPVQQFVDVVQPAPVVEDDLVLRQPARRRGKKAEVSDADESTG